MRNALLVTSEFGKDGGGLSKSAFNFSQLLQQVGYHVYLVLPSSTGREEELTSLQDQGFTIITSGITVIPGGYKTSLFDSLSLTGSIKSIVYQLRGTEIDFIFAFGAGGNGLLAYEIQKHYPSNLIILLRGSEVNLSINNPELLQYNRRCFRAASAIVGLSDELVSNSKEIFYNRFAAYSVIPNWIDFQEPSKKELRGNKIIFGTGARNLNEKKGVGNLIKSLHHLNKIGNQKYLLRLAGSIDDDLLLNYKQLARDLGVDESVCFLGNMSEGEFKQEIASWDFIIQGSICEGFSNTLANGLSISKPFIMSNTSFIAERIKKVSPHLVIEDLRPEAIAMQIHKTYSHPEFLNWVSDAVATLKPLVSYDKVKDSWISLLEGLKSNNLPPLASTDHILSVILHDISDENYTNVDIPKAEFNKLCALVYNRGFKLCSAKHYFDSVEKQNLIICTFDDAYQGVYDLAFPILRSFGFTATIFVCSDYIGKNNSWNKKDKHNRVHLDIQGLNELNDNGWEIGSHGSNHISLLRLDTEDIIENLKSSKQTLSAYFGEIVSYAYPYGDYNYHISKLTKQHYQNIFAVDTGGTHISLDRHQIRRYTTDELIRLLS